LRTAEGLRRFSYPGTVTILEAGGDLPYDRTALSKKVLDPDGDLVPVRLRSPEDLDRLGIELRLRSRAESLDPSRHTVRLADGNVIEYSVLVVATGASARRLPGVPPADVTVVEPAGYPLGRVLGSVVGARLARLHESRGVPTRKTQYWSRSMSERAG
jgi:NADPH-dependent 2,4-dienoyl-CoA reductase/sulfur reductase-like enzyme